MPEHDDKRPRLEDSSATVMPTVRHRMDRMDHEGMEWYIAKTRNAGVDVNSHLAGTGLPTGNSMDPAPLHPRFSRARIDSSRSKTRRSRRTSGMDILSPRRADVLMRRCHRTLSLASRTQASTRREPFPSVGVR